MDYKFILGLLVGVLVGILIVAIVAPQQPAAVQ
jgi:uncharacterized membrane-anchored protein YhcB (DUF1043 family)